MQAKPKKIHWLILVLLLVKEVQDAGIKCNLNLIQSFHLKGLRYSSTRSMSVCPTVFERCCSMMDELAILKLWNSYTGPNLKRFASRLNLAHRTFISMHDALTKLKVDNMVVHYLTYKWIPYIHHTVEESSIPASVTPDTLNEQLEYFLPGEGPVRKLDFNDSKLPMLFQMVTDVRSKVALVMYLACLAKIVSENFLDYELYLEWIKAEGMVDNISEPLKRLKDQKRMFNGLKAGLAKQISNAQKELKYVFSRIKRDFSKNPKLKGSVDSLDNVYQKEMDAILKRMKNFTNNAKTAEGDKEDMERLQKLRSQIFKDVIKTQKHLFQSANNLQKKKEKVQQEEFQKKKAKRVHNFSKIRYSMNKSQKRFVKAYNGYIESLQNDYVDSRTDDLESNHLTEDVQPENFFKTIEEIGDRKLKQSKHKGKQKNLKKKTDKLSQSKSTKKERRRLFLPKVGNFVKNLFSSPPKLPDSSLNLPQLPSLPQIPGLPSIPGDLLTSNSQKPLGGLVEGGVNFIKNLFGPKKKRVIIYHPNGKITQKVYNIIRNYRIWQKNVVPKFAAMYQKLMKYKIDMPVIDEKYFADRSMHVPSFETQQELKSQTFKRFLFREFVSVNKAKLKYCYQVDQEFKNFQNTEFADSLLQISKYRQGVLDLKKTIYCAVCDAHNSRNFVTEKNLMVFEEKFCFDLIDKNSLFIRWNHILLIEYMDLTYQYIKCYESSGSVFDFPFRSFINQHKRRIPFVKRCLDRVAEGAEDFMSYCYFMCSDFKLHGMSTFWDGDTQLATKMLMVIFNFLRKKNLFPETQVKQLEKILELELLNDLSFADQKDGGSSNKSKKSMANKPEISVEFVKKQLRSIQKALGTNTSPIVERSLLDTSADNELKHDNFDKYMSQLKDLHSHVTELNAQDTEEEFTKQTLPKNPTSNLKAVKKTQKRSEAKLSSNTKKNKAAGASSENYSAVEFGNASSAGSISSFRKKQRVKVNKNKKAKSTTSQKTERKLSQESISSSSHESTESQNSAETVSLSNQRQLEEANLSANPERRLFLNEYSGTERFHSEIFEKRVRPVDIACMRTFYTSRSGALNPIRDLNYSDFKNIDPKHIIINKFKAYKYENLRPETVMGYLDADSTIVRGFNSDLEDMDFKLMVGNPTEKETMMESKVQPYKITKETEEEKAAQSSKSNMQDKLVDVTDEDLHLKPDSSHDTYTMVENAFFNKA